jgi:catechol 2,3-dioxygenase-like lactoylglutathione lyase family enzyme
MLHHIELYVSHLERSLAFWTPFLTGLGYAESQRWSEGVGYQSGATYLCFVQAPAEHVGAGYHRQRVGLNHLAFHAKSRAQVDEVARWAATAGFTCLYADRYPHAGGPGCYAFYCEDPDRIKVELVAPPEGYIEK